MQTRQDAAARDFGESQPAHVRIFFEQDGQYWLHPSQNDLKPTSFEAYMAQETKEGYTLKYLTGIVNDPDKIRLITVYEPSKAERLLRMNRQDQPISPVNLAVFQENQHVYTGVPGINQDRSLDDYLAAQALLGYHLKHAVGVLENSPSHPCRKIRVRTEIEPAKRTLGENLQKRHKS